MDLDDLEAPIQATSRVSKFAPKSSKPKPKPKSEPVPKPEPESQPSSSLPFSKTEPQDFDLTIKKNEDGMETDAPTHAKPEPNGTVNVDAEPKSEDEDDSRQGDPMDENSVEDAVVREIDVFFAPSIDADTQLYVLQYPLRPCWRPYELDEQCEEVRLKPESSEVEVDLSVELESSHIDREFTSKLNYTKETLSTWWKPHHANGCAVGLLKGDKLHLHPINAVVQLRPRKQHLNSGSSKRKDIISTGANATIKNEGSVEEKSAATSKKQCWVPLKYHGCKSDISSRYLQQMAAQESSSINFTMSAYDYITTLCPGVSSNKLPNGPSKRYLLSLPVEERLKKMLTEGPPLRRFGALKHFASEYSDEELLGFLRKHAVLLQGLWVPKSSLLYPQGGKESIARCYALVLFSKNLKVQSSDVSVQGSLGKHVKNFLKVFGLEKDDKDKTTSKPKHYWKFRELPDESFKKDYPNVFKEQEELFQVMEQQLSDAIGNVGKHKLGKSAAAKQRCQL